jgi:hypothetical protein
MANKKNNKKKAGGKKKTVTPPQQKNDSARLRQGKLVSRQGPPKGARLGHHATVCSITDPFCIHARGAQYPDGGPPTITIPLKAFFDIAAYSTTGRTKVTFLANPAYPALWWSVNGGTTWDVSATGTAVSWNNSLLSTYAKEIRITSFGIQFRSMMTANTAKGVILVTNELAPPTLGSTLTPFSIMMGETATFNLGANTEFSWVAKPQPSAKLFRPYSDFTNVQTNLDWSGVTVEVVGGDTTSMIQYLSAELFMNVEFTLQSAIGSTGTGLAQLTRYPPPPNPVAQRAADVVYNKTPAILDAVAGKASDYLSRMAMNALEDVGKMALTFL